jgi:DNA-binding NtrC family response regulator
MRRVAADIRRHCNTRAPVLLQGESGTGKDVVARALHTLSGRTGAYVPINGGALPDSLADAELFGHLRGAFTGASASRAGAFEQAHKGTLFLDEVADLSPALQVKLLRAVEDGSIRPLGAIKAQNVDVRTVSASWAPLGQCVADGRFRLDLYHRLSTVVIELPPLRKRKSDFAPLARFLLARMRDEVGPRELDGAALALLSSYSWPGNVRELAAVLYRAALRSAGHVIHASDVQLPEVPRSTDRAERPRRDDVRELVRRHAGNVTAASRAARVPRSTFRFWLEKAREVSGGVEHAGTSDASEVDD